MVAYDLFFYVWLITVALPAGAAIGWSTGWLMKKVLREPQRRVPIALLDVISGIVGFVLGAFVSVMSTSFIYEEWSNGKLVNRRTDGFADYEYVFAILGAVTLVVIVRLSIRLIRKLICKTRVNADERLDARA
jgi:uncharacterized membrane protein YeaQ/YmgE (transglycosylase-associated protein family)